MSRLQPVFESFARNAKQHLPGTRAVYSEIPRVFRDFRRLLHRVHARLYPETIPVLASYWLKTVYWSGYTSREWNELDRLLKNSLRHPVPEPWPQLVADLRSWIRESRGRSGKRQQPDPRTLIVHRPRLDPDALIPYTIRLLNEWLPQEIARMLVDEADVAEPQPGGIPVLSIGKALEGLLLRDRLSVPTLEALLNLRPVSPVYIYPADLEVLGDVILFLLGRTDAPAPPVFPAHLLATVPGATLPSDYADDFQRAQLVATASGEELQVPITSNEMAQLLAEAPQRFGSIAVTADGRCWEAARFDSGECRVVYRQTGRLRIDYSGARACLLLPWPDDCRSWSGAVRLPGPIKIFGRQWKVAQWEKDATRGWLRLVVLRALPATALASTVQASLRRSEPASVDLAWAEMETALAASFFQDQLTPLDRMQREDLIPLGRALLTFAQSVLSRRFRNPEAIESHLRRIRFVQSGLDPAYGMMPWRILPMPVRKALLRGDPVWLNKLHGVFRGVPEGGTTPALLSYFTKSGGHRRSLKPAVEVHDKPSPVE